MTELEFSAIPYRNPAYTYRDGFLVHVERRADAVFVNPTAAMVWGLCDGQTSIEDIIADLRTAYPENSHAVPEDVLSALRKLIVYGIVTVEKAGITKA
jgi:hypothetical protein